MKKTLIVLLLTITFTPCFSQYSFGVKGGLNFKSLSDNVGIIDIKMGQGWDLGVFANIHLKDKWFLQTDLLYSEQVYSAVCHSSPCHHRTNTISKYLTLPLYIGYVFFKENNIALKGMVGVEINSQIPQKSKDKFLGISRTCFKYGTPNIYCGNIGLGIDIAKFSVDFKYIYGYTRKITIEKNIGKYYLDNEYEQYKKANIYYHYIRTSIGWKIFPTKKMKFKKNNINL